MRNIRSRKTMKDWARLAARLGLLLTEPGVRAAIGDQMKDRVDDVTDTISSKYEDAVDRLEAIGAALQGRTTYWPSRAAGFLLGVGVGAGLGILLAPGSGTETREAIRGKAVDVKNKVVESASMATGKIRQSVTSMPPPTGTEG
jgi:YtxH-like protein